MACKRTNCNIFLLTVCLLSACKAFYLPGLNPVTYCTSESSMSKTCLQKVNISVNRLDSVKSVVSHDYEWFDFCGIDTTRTATTSENLGQVLFQGERIRSSVYNITFMKNEECKVACEKTYVGVQGNLKKIFHAIKLNYLHHWIIDNMPVTWCYDVVVATTGRVEQFCQMSHPIGCYITPNGKLQVTCVIDFGMTLIQNDTYYFFNHVDITVEYHPLESNAMSGRLVSARIVPRSIKHTYPIKSDGCRSSLGNIQGPFGISGKEKGEIKLAYTYSVYFKENKSVEWSSRWDYILDLVPQYTGIRGFYPMTSLHMVSMLLSSVGMARLILRIKAVARHDQADNSNGLRQVEFGWKLIHGDVFRPPNKGMLLSVFIGSGTQILGMFVVTLTFACLGFLPPANRGALGTCALVLYALFGTLAGYTAARIYKTFGGDKWKSNFLLTAFLVPGVIFIVFSLLNLLLWGEQSSAAVPCGTFVVLLTLWLCASVPLTFVGAYYGFKRPPIEHPVCTNQSPRQIPKQSWESHFLTGMFMGGFFSFVYIFPYLIRSIWGDQIYTLGFLLFTFILCVITTSELTILMCYFHLCAEDYRWWWRSFITSGFTAFYLFLYSIYLLYYFVSELEFEGVSSAILYFGYTILYLFIFFLAMGTIGFFSCFLFVSKIYGLVKVD